MVYILTNQILDMYHKCINEFCKSNESTPECYMLIPAEYN